jgi:hypothetical protein
VSLWIFDLKTRHSILSAGKKRAETYFGWSCTLLSGGNRFKIPQGIVGVLQLIADEDSDAVEHQCRVLWQHDTRPTNAELIFLGSGVFGGACQYE